jgi:hypothetical protein
MRQVERPEQNASGHDITLGKQTYSLGLFDLLAPRADRGLKKHRLYISCAEVLGLKQYDVILNQNRRVSKR